MEINYLALIKQFGGKLKSQILTKVKGSGPAKVGGKRKIKNCFGKTNKHRSMARIVKSMGCN